MANDDGFHINKEYADKYNTWRQKEELQKLKDKYGDVDDLEPELSSSSSESEDEDAEALTAAVERDWLRTLSAIKNKDPKIYDPQVKFYKDQDVGEGTSKQRDKVEKPMFLKDYERKVILDKGGIISDDDSDNSDRLEAEKLKNDPSYYEEQEQIKLSLKEAIGDSDDEDGDLFIPRKKNKEEKEKDEAEYLLWLKGQKQNLDPGDQVGIELNPLKQYWTKPDLGDGEKFLRDYFLNKQYLDDDDGSRIPTYAEIVDEDISEEERELEKEEEFERKYNFRFEEPDAEFIKTYPRTIGGSVRRKPEKRVKTRAERKERKKREKEKKLDELKQLKNLKKREILDKLDKIKEITGNSEVGFTEKDVQGDFNPEEHDRLMKEVFDDDYYIEADGEKPVFNDDEDLGLDDDAWDDWCGTGTDQKGEPHAASRSVEDYGDQEDAEQQNFNMDADDDIEDSSMSLDGKTKKKRKSKFARALERRKPVFDPEETTFEAYFDEYYKLDYEDIVADQPCRFKYRNVLQNNFGLDTAEVLTCPDRELNAWVSLKKMTQYRTEEEEEFDNRLYAKKGRQHKKKLQILPSLDDKRDEEEECLTSQSATTSKKKRRKRKKKNRQETSDQETKQSSPLKTSADTTKDKKRKNLDHPKDSVSVKKARLSEESIHSRDINVESTAGTADIVHTPFKSGLPEKHKKPKKSQKCVDSSQSIKSRDSHKSVIMDSPQKHKKSKLGKKIKKGQGKGLGSGGFHMSEERLKAYGIDPKKFKYTYMKKMHEEQQKKNVS